MEKIVKVYEELYADIQATDVKDFESKVKYHGVDDDKMSELCKKHDCEWIDGYIESCTYTVAGDLKTRYCAPVSGLPDTIAAYRKAIKPVKSVWLFEPKKKNINLMPIMYQDRLKRMIEMTDEEFEKMLDRMDALSQLSNATRVILFTNAGYGYGYKPDSDEYKNAITEARNLPAEIKKKFNLLSETSLKGFVELNFKHYNFIEDYAEYIMLQRAKINNNE